MLRRGAYRNRLRRIRERAGEDGTGGENERRAELTALLPTQVYLEICKLKTTICQILATISGLAFT